ncbi:hypothetical protein DRP05_15180 [Archaeoglobales archaeon]|nr:MAG: hypothetical protein DRP05_15180 [Archaeoglobales archaeon]
MELEDWYKFYDKILEDFGFSREKDEEAAKIMHELGKYKLLDYTILEKTIKNKSVAVVGGAIEKSELEFNEEFNEDVIITSGKAVVKLINKMTPQIHVTDMEEDDKILVNLEKKGCILVLHAHGDNIDRIRSVVLKLTKFIGTTQSKPFNKIYNFTGFTDGDRAAIIAKRFGAKKIKLYGFDFERAEGIKKKKLKWAKKILEFEGLI